MTIIYSLFNRYSVRQIGVVMAVGAGGLLLLAAAFRALTPPPPPPPEPSALLIQLQKEQPTSFSNLSFVGEDLDVPETLPSISGQQTALTPEIVLTQLQRQYKLIQDDQYDRLWVGQTHSVTLGHDGSITLTRNDQTTPPREIINPNVTAAFGTSFIESILPNLALSPILNQAAYWAGATEYISVPRNRGQLITLPYTYTVQNIPILWQNSQSYPVEITMDARGEVSKAVFQPLYIRIQTIQQHPTISASDAFKRISSDTAALAWVVDPQGGPLVLSSISDGTFNQVAIEYRMIEPNTTTYPYYVFTGRATSTDGKQITATIVTPAVSE
jgi:hypothetical protein